MGARLAQTGEGRNGVIGLGGGDWNPGGRGNAHTIPHCQIKKLPLQCPPTSCINPYIPSIASSSLFVDAEVLGAMATSSIGIVAFSPMSA